MKNSDIERIKQKIKKLLALSKSPNENEAIAALEKAQVLMNEYHLDAGECLYEKYPVKATKRLSKWRVVLANAVAPLYCCETFRSEYEGKIFFYGDKFDAFMAGEMYNYLAKTIERMSKQNVSKKASLKYRNSYRLGVACRISIRLDELGQTASWGLERETKMLSVRQSFENEIITTSEKMSFDSSKKGFNRGVTAGKDISLHRQTTGSGGRYIEGGAS